jgi:transketolase
MRFVGLKDTYVESGDPWDLLKKYHLTADDIAAAGEAVVKAKKGA